MLNGGASKNHYDVMTSEESWIYGYELENKQQSTVWSKTTKVVAKQTIACFFWKSEHIETVPLEKRTRMNSEWYTKICLADKIRKANQQKRNILHHNIRLFEYLTKKSIWWGNRGTILTWHPMIFFIPANQE